MTHSCQSRDYVCLLVKVKGWGWLSVEQLPGMPAWGARWTSIFEQSNLDLSSEKLVVNGH